jgi:large subunit ribosomal protein L5
MPIGCKVTLRGEGAEGFLKRALWIRENRIAVYSFDTRGNLSFGITDYTDFEGMKYDPQIGIFGMDVSVSITRPGHRIVRRRIMKRKIPRDHVMSKEEAMKFMREKFDVEVVE